MSTVEITSDMDNKLLARRELDCIFKGASGFLNRTGAAEAIATKFGVPTENVRIVSLKGSFGIRDLEGSVYIFSDPNAPKKQLAEYISLRHLSKEERKKVREDRKKSKSASKAASPSPQSKPSAPEKKE